MNSQANNNQFVLDGSERYCVICSGGTMFGVPSLAIRSIVPCPQITPAPHSDPILKGICHVQNEFMPVVSLQALLQVQYETRANSQQQLAIILGPHGPWGLLIDQAVSLVALDTSLSTFSNEVNAWSNVTLGSASFNNEVIQVLDPAAIYQYTSNLLDRFWQSAEQAELELANRSN